MNSTQTVHDFTVTTIEGVAQPLAEYRGKVLLIVNTASQCGNTRQYESLQALHKKFATRGFSVLAFPANNFMGQEPGENAEIAEFCRTKYKVTFPLFAKISVKGVGIDPLYAHLTHDPAFEGVIGWNFAKFLIGPDGKVIARYEPTTDPMDAEIVDKLEAMLPPRR